MTLLMGGAVAVILGLIGFIVWIGDFMQLLKGSVPILLLLGGAVAVYIGFDEMEGKLREDREKDREDLEKAKEEIELIKAKAEEYREELDRLKEEKDKT